MKKLLLSLIAISFLGIPITVFSAVTTVPWFYNTTTKNVYTYPADFNNVGIGTTSPYAKLSVVGEVVASFFTATTSTATSTFAGSVAIGDSRVYAETGDSSLAVGRVTNSNSASAIIASSTPGSVAIGNVGGGSNAGRIISTGGGSLAGGFVSPGAAGTASIQALGRGCIAWGYNPQTNNTVCNGDASFALGQNVKALASLATAIGTGFTNSIASTFQVGYGGESPMLHVEVRKTAIGTTTPYARLSVFGLSTGAGQTFEIADSASTTLMKVLDNGRTYFKGNVGIGTTTPYALLSVSNDLTIPSFVVDDTISPDVTPFMITHEGNVGVGTTSPATRLSVSREGQDAGLYVALSDGGFGVRFYNDVDETMLFRVNPAIQSVFLAENGGGTVGIGTSTNLGVLAKLSVKGNGTGTGMVFNTSGSTNISGLTVLDNGNVGIGTTSPYVRLAVTETDSAKNSAVVIQGFSDGGFGTKEVLRVNNNLGEKMIAFAGANLAGVGDYGTMNFYGTASSTRDQYSFGDLTWFNNSGEATGDLRMGTIGTVRDGGAYQGSTRITPRQSSGAFAPTTQINYKGNLSVADTNSYSRFSVKGAGTGTGQLFELYNSASTTRMRMLDNGTTFINGTLGVATTSPASTLDVGTKGNSTREYLQIDSEAGAPPAEDCGSLSHSGRMIIDHTNDVLYVCNEHSGNGWDTVPLTP